MTIESNVVRIETREEGEMLDITEKVQAVVGKGTIKKRCSISFRTRLDRGADNNRV